MSAPLTEAQLAATERECTACHRVLPVSSFYRGNHNRRRFTRCMRCLSAQKRVSGNAWYRRRAKTPVATLTRREERRLAVGFMRCKLSRPGRNWGDTYVSCGGVVFLDRRREHLVDVHGIAEPTAAEIAKSFGAVKEPADKAADKEDANG